MVVERVIRPPVVLLAALWLTGSAGCTLPDRTDEESATTNATPVVLFDEGHFNYHVVEGSNESFVGFLQGSGYTVVRSASRLLTEDLELAQILVIAMPLAERNQVRADETDWSRPNPSAFTEEEIAVVRDWVDSGGGLLLIADHMPIAGSVEDLAEAFGVHLSNGFAFRVNDGEVIQDPIQFTRPAGTLVGHPITNGFAEGERVESVLTYTGSAFQPGAGLEPLLRFGSSVVSLEPDSAWEFSPGTPELPIDGWLQGGAMQFGRGRVVVFGEAGMFFAVLHTLAQPQVLDACEEPCWVHEAAEHPQLLLNTMRWLSGHVESPEPDFRR